MTSSAQATSDGTTWSQLPSKLRAYVALTKPRIIELLLITTVPTMVVAARGFPSGWLVAATVAGGTLAAGGANAMNMYADRDIDRVMERTRRRPLVTGAVSARGALVFALILQLVAFVELSIFVNLLSAALALCAAAFYVFVYTLWLKRTSSQNIVIGGAAGAVPVLVGWAAVTGSLGLAPVVLFAIVFLWTPPHFWALAVKYREDYSAAGVPMLPSVSSLSRTSKEIVLYALALVGASLLLVPAADMGYLYLAAALVLGAVFVVYAIKLLLDMTSLAAMRVFGYSITYLTLLFLAMGADELIRHH